MKYDNILKQLRIIDDVSISIVESLDIEKGGELFPEELSIISSEWSERRKRTFVMGRMAAGKAMKACGGKAFPVLKGEMDEPIWQGGFTGSIAHKDNIAVAVATKSNLYDGLGIDIEDSMIVLDETEANLFCTKEELCFIKKDPRKALLFFSIKESVIKANYMAYGKLLEMKEVNCCKLNQNYLHSTTEVKCVLLHKYIISLCLISKMCSKDDM